MYANLRVNVLPNDAGDDEPGEELCAYEVTADEHGVLVLLDDPDAEGHEPAGERELDLSTHSIRITANF